MFRHPPAAGRGSGSGSRSSFEGPGGTTARRLRVRSESLRFHVGLRVLGGRNDTPPSPPGEARCHPFRPSWISQRRSPPAAHADIALSGKSPPGHTPGRGWRRVGWGRKPDPPFRPVPTRRRMRFQAVTARRHPRLAKRPPRTTGRIAGAPAVCVFRLPPDDLPASARPRSAGGGPSNDSASTIARLRGCNPLLGLFPLRHAAGGSIRPAGCAACRPGRRVGFLKFLGVLGDVG